MAISSAAPKAVSHPDIPYDKLGVSIMIDPIFKQNSVTARAILTARRYRVLPDGTIDVSNETPVHEAHLDVFADAFNEDGTPKDAALATALAAIDAAIQNYVVAKGY